MQDQPSPLQYSASSFPFPSLSFQVRKIIVRIQNNKGSLQEGSMGKGTGHRASCPEFDPQAPNGGRKKTNPTHCLSTSQSALPHMTTTHT